MATRILSRLRIWATRTFISVLLSLCNPSTVGRAVRAVVVDTIYGVLGRWARSHVSNKRSVACAPFITHHYAATAVVLVVVMGFVVAAGFHAGPCSILGGRSQANAPSACDLSMRARVRVSRLAHVAAATYARSVAQGHGANQFFGSAVAATQPNRDRVIASRRHTMSSNRYESAKPPSCVIVHLTEHFSRFGA